MNDKLIDDLVNSCQPDSQDITKTIDKWEKVYDQRRNYLKPKIVNKIRQVPDLVAYFTKFSILKAPFGIVLVNKFLIQQNICQFFFLF